MLVWGLSAQIGEFLSESSVVAGVPVAVTATYCVIRQGCRRLPSSLKTCGADMKTPWACKSSRT